MSLIEPEHMELCRIKFHNKNEYDGKVYLYNSNNKCFIEAFTPLSIYTRTYPMSKVVQWKAHGMGPGVPL